MRTRWATFVAVAVLAGAMVAPTAASASTTEAIADTGGMTLVLGSGVSPLEIAVSLDDIGDVTEVVVGGDSVDGNGEHVVRFSSEEDGTRVSVHAKNHRLAADVKAADLADIVGPHEWAAPLFGSTEDTVVAFEVVDNGGYPELAAVDVVFSDADFEVGDVKTETEGDEAESSVKITFTREGYTMTLKIQVSTESDDDEDSSVKIKVVLSGKDVQNLRRVAIDDIVGEHTWDGHLCDGKPISIHFTISEAGEITVTDGEGEYTIKEMPHGFVAEWDGSKAKVTVELKEKQDGEWDLKVRSKSTDKCNPSDDKAEKDRGNSGQDKDSEDRGRPDKDSKDKKNKNDDDDEEDED